MRLLILLLVFIPLISEAQSVTEMKKRIAGIISEQDASLFLLQNKDVKGKVVQVDNTKVLFEYLEVFEPGEVVTLEPNDAPDKVNVYKILHPSAPTDLQVRYIYFNGRELNMKQIDSLRSLIVQKYNSGEPFASLAQQYSMDGNAANGGLLTWKEGMMIKEFEEGVSAHAPGQVFTLDIPDKKWFYVIQNSIKPAKSITVLFIEMKK
jgi:parvulin-like peptidyl-prolyl isomerase